MNGLIDVAIAWFWAHLDPIRNWVTLFFAAIAAYVGLAKHMRDRAASRDALNERWSIRSAGSIKMGDQNLPELILRLRDANEYPLRLNAFAVARPRGARIAKVAYDTLRSGRTEKIPGDFSDRLVYDRDLNGDFRSGGGASTDSSLTFYVQMPPRPFWSRSKLVRLHLSVEAEEMTSRRSAIRLQVKSQPIDWASNRADIAQ